MAELASSYPLRVLVVDDCPDTTASQALLIGLWGHQVHTANTAEEALRLAIEQHPDVILLDIGLPRMSGWELASRLRKRPELNRIYVVVVSGFSQPGDLRHSQEAGCDMHLTKPVPPERLQQLLAACYKEKRIHDS